MRRQESECGKSIADINPYFRHLSADILRLSRYSMRRTKLKESDCIACYNIFDATRKLLTLHGSKLLQGTFVEQGKMAE